MNEDNVWKCAAIDHGVTIFPNGKIGPCCLISAKYLKPINMLRDPNRFADLKTHKDNPPAACHECIQAEYYGDKSYREMFNEYDNHTPGLQFVDIRNSNLCNLKCRTCGPHFSNKWGDELGYEVTIKHQALDEYLPHLLTDSLHWMYFTGGEPLINRDHWELLENLIQSGRAKNIRLMYNTNLTTLKYKDKDIVSIWKQFNAVTINCSIDAAGEQINYIRSDSDWNTIKQNFDRLHEFSCEWNRFNIVLTPTMSILNIWFFADLVKFASKYQVACKPIILTGPHIFSLNVVPTDLKALALEQLHMAAELNVIEPATIDRMRKLLELNEAAWMFDRAIRDILLMDHVRSENLFGILPFKRQALSNIHKFDEYK